MKSNEMPEPDCIVEYPDGSFACAMFHYAAEDVSYEAIARSNGFECDWLKLEDDESDAAQALFTEYEVGASDVPARWKPPVRDGWMIASVGDTDDGPMAVYIRKFQP